MSRHHSDGHWEMLRDSSVGEKVWVIWDMWAVRMAWEDAHPQAVPPQDNPHPQWHHRCHSSLSAGTAGSQGSSAAAGAGGRQGWPPLLGIGASTCPGGSGDVSWGGAGGGAAPGLAGVGGDIPWGGNPSRGIPLGDIPLGDIPSCSPGPAARAAPAPVRRTPPGR